MDGGLTAPMRAVVRAGALAGAVAAVLAPGSPARGQAGVFLYAPSNASATQTLFTTNVDGSLILNGTVVVNGAADYATMRGDQAYVYVSNSTPAAAFNTITVVDTATRAVVQTIFAFVAYGGAFSPDGTKFYVAIHQTDLITDPGISVFSVDAASGKLTAAGTIANAGSAPRALAFSPDGTRLYIADEGAVPNHGSFRVVDTATNKVVNIQSIGGKLTDLALSPDGSRAYVTDSFNKIVRVIDTSTAFQIATVATGNQPFGIVVSKDGKYFYVSNMTDGTIRQYSTTTNALVATFASGLNPFGLTISPDGNTLYVGLGGADAGVRLFTIDQTTGALNQGTTIATATDVSHVAMCSGSSALLGRGGTFLVKSTAAMPCATGAGGLTFTGGTLMIGAGGLTLSTPMTLGNGGVTINTNGNTATYAGAISGIGALVKAGDGTLILTGVNSYTGGTQILGGTLQGNAASLPGNILNNAALVLDQTGSGTMTGVITGTGTITKQGSGLLVLNGNSRTFSGTTTINAGTLRIGDANNPGAALGGNITVNQGGILSGHGSVVGSVSNLTGTVSPGGSIGTLTVAGNYVQGAAGTLAIELSASEASKLAVAGSAQIAGTLALTGGGYNPGTRFQVLTAGGGVMGTFTTITGASLGNLVQLVPLYSANEVALQFQLADIRPFATTDNQRRGAAGIVAASSVSATLGLASALGAVGNLSTVAQVRSAVDALAGAAENYTGIATATARAAAVLSKTVGRQIFQTHAGSGEAQAAMGGARAMAVQIASLDPIAQYAAGPEGVAPSPWSAWASGFGVFGGVAGNGNSHDLSYSTGGTVFGADYRLDPELLVGGFAGYGGTGTSTSGLSGSGMINSYAVGTYASWTAQGRGRGTYVDGMLGYAYNDSELRRTVSFPGFPASGVKGTGDTHQLLSFVEAGRGYAVGPALTAVPFVNLNLTVSRQDELTEASAVGLVVAPRTTTTFGSVIGGRLEQAVELGDGRTLNAGIKLGWAHVIADDDPRVTARFAGAPGSNFTLAGAMPRRDGAVVGAGVDARLGSRTSLYLHYDGVINGQDDAHALLGGVRLTW